MTSKKQILKNSLFNSGGWVVTILITLLMTPILVNKLGADRYGFYTILLSFVGYFGVLDLGLGQGLIKFVAEFKAKKEFDQVNRFVNSAFLIQIITGILGAAVLVIFSIQLIDVLKVPAGLKQEALTSLLISAPGFFMTMMAALFSSFLMGLQEYDTRTKVDLSINLTLNIALILFAIAGKGLVEFSLLTTGSSLVMTAAYFFVVRKRAPYWKLGLELDRGIFKTLFSFSLYLFLTRLWYIAYNYLVRFVISAILGPGAVTSFVVPTKITNAIAGLLGNAFTVIFPYASELGARQDYAEAQKITLVGSRLFASIAIPVHLFLIVCSRQILTIWMGPAFAENGWIILSLLALASLLSTLTTVPNTVVIGLGYSKLIGKFALFQLLVYAILIVPLTFQWGVLGTSIALVLGNLPGIYLSIYVITVIQKIKIAEFYRQVISFHLIPVILALPFCFYLGPKSQNSMLYLFVGAGLVGVYGILMVVTKWIPLNKLLSQIRGESV